MCRDGYRAECVTEGCDGVVTCRDNTHCQEHLTWFESW